jgi:hypothetical protein
MVLANQSDTHPRDGPKTISAINCWIVKFDGVWAERESNNEEVLGEEKL